MSKKSRRIILIFVLFFLLLYTSAKFILTPERTAKLVASRLEKILGKSLTLKEIRLKNFFIQVRGIKIDEPSFSLKVENLLLQPCLLDLIRKREIKRVLLERPFLQIKTGKGRGRIHPTRGLDKSSPYNFEIPYANLPRSIKIAKGEIVLLGGKEKIKVSDLTAEINGISSILPWNWRINGNLNDVLFSLRGKINPLRKEFPIDLQLLFEKLPLLPSRKDSFLLGGKVHLSGQSRKKLNLRGDLRITSPKSTEGEIKVVGCLRNGISFNGRIDFKDINFRTSNYPSLKNLNGYLRIAENSILESPITIEKIDYHQLGLYNIKISVSYKRDEDSLQIKDFTYNFCEGKGRGNLGIRGLLSGKNCYSFSTKIADINLETFSGSYGGKGLISGILQCQFKMKGEKRKFPEISASFSTVKKQGVEQAISFRAVEKISMFAGGSVIKGALMDYPYQKLAGSFRIKDGYFTLWGDVKRGKKEYLLLGPSFGQSLNILIDPRQNAISLDNLKTRLKSALAVSPRTKIQLKGVKRK